MAIKRLREGQVADGNRSRQRVRERPIARALACAVPDRPDLARRRVDGAFRDVVALAGFDRRERGVAGPQFPDQVVARLEIPRRNDDHGTLFRPDSRKSYSVGF